MLRAAIITVWAATGLSACSTSDYKNIVHADQAPAYQRVNTVAKARAFFDDTTLVSTVADGQARQVVSDDGAIIYHVPRVLFVEYFAPDGRVYAAREGTLEVTEGFWRIEQFGRAYPQLCRAYPVVAGLAIRPNIRDSDYSCQWPSDLFGKFYELYEGNPIGLRSGKVPSAMLTKRIGTTFKDALRRQGKNPVHLISLGTISN